MNNPEKNYLDDEKLAQKYYKTNDNYWLGLLLQRHAVMLLGICMKYLQDRDLAKDAVQEIILQVLNDFKKHKISFFKSWLYIVAKNHCLSTIRKRKHIEIYSSGIEEEFKDITAVTDDITEKQSKENIFQNLEASVEMLNEDQKTCIKLFYIENKSYKEIAEITGFNLINVKSFIQNGKRNLKNFIEKKQHQHG